MKVLSRAEHSQDREKCAFDEVFCLLDIRSCLFAKSVNNTSDLANGDIAIDDLAIECLGVRAIGES